MALLLAPAALAQGADPALLDDTRPVVTVVAENDAIAGTDRNYTNGLRLSWTSGSAPADGVSRFIAERLLGADGQTRRRWGVSLNHTLFTPDDVETKRPLPRQHPYAGWAFAELHGILQQPDAVDQFGLRIGLLGPSAGGEWVQNEFHDLIGAADVRGWENQLGDEATFAFSYDRKFRRLAEVGLAVPGASTLGLGGVSADLTPNAGFTLGTVTSTAQAGLTVRLGDDLRNDFGPPRVRPSLAGSGFFTPRDGVSGYVFAGAEIRFQAHNRFTDGPLWGEDDTGQLTRRPWVNDYQAGAVLQWRATQIAVTYVLRDEEFDEQGGRQVFGAFSVSRRF